MFTGQYERKAVTLAGVLAVALIGTAAVGLWAGAVGPASTNAALVNPAAAIDLDAEACIGDPLEDVGPTTPLNAAACCPNGCPCGPPPPCRLVDNDCEQCCFVCPGGQPFCWAG